MSTARIEGKGLRIVLNDRKVDVEVDWIEVDAAPEQAGVVLTGHTKYGKTMGVYVDKNGEPCDETTVEFFAFKARKPN